MEMQKTSIQKLRNLQKKNSCACPELFVLVVRKEFGIVALTIIYQYEEKGYNIGTIDLIAHMYQGLCLSMSIIQKFNRIHILLSGKYFQCLELIERESNETPDAKAHAPNLFLLDN